MSSICFVSFYSGSLLFPGKQGAVGGAEVQQHFLAKALDEQGVHVCYVIGDEPETKDLIHQKFSVYRSYGRYSGRRFIKFIYPQFVKVWRALRSADCDYYYVRGLRVDGGITWLFCIFHRCKYIVAIASDRECRANTITRSRWNPKRHLILLGLKRANQVIAQTSWQRAQLRKEFGVNAKVIRNIMPADTRYMPLMGQPRNFLWVGTIVPNKRPEIYLDLAERHPDLRFIMIGPARSGFEGYRANIKRQASKISNLTYVDYVAPDEIHAFYRESDVVVLTSSYEGFSNVLLHAWSCGRPVVTSCDPDGVVARYQLGYVTHQDSDFERVLGEIGMMGSIPLLNDMGQRARSYIERFHTPTVIVREFYEALNI